MPAGRNERMAPFVLLSMLIHAGIIVLVPLHSVTRLGIRPGGDGKLEISMNIPPKESAGQVVDRKSVAVPLEKPQVSLAVKPVTPASSRPHVSVLVAPESAKPAPSRPYPASEGASAASTAPPFGSDIVSYTTTLGFPTKYALALPAPVTVRLLATVSADGSCQDVEIVTSSGQKELDKWARDAAREFLVYGKIGSVYKVVVGIAIKPESRVASWSIPAERVRVVGQ